MTLIELLIVIIILTTLVSAAIPLMSPTNDDRRLREASRMVNTFISTAQASAVALQRPFGVAIKRLSKDTAKPDDNSASVELYYVEQPTPFVGFNEQSMARVALYSPANSNWYGGGKNLVIIEFVTRGSSSIPTADFLPAGWDADQVPGGVLRPNDVIEINGTRYQMISDKNDFYIGTNPLDTTTGFFVANPNQASALTPPRIVATPLNDSGQMINVKYDDKGNELGTVNPPVAPYWTDAASYKILRQPTKNSAEPLQLPEGTAIDLRASGLGDGTTADDYFFYYPTTTNVTDQSRQVDNDQDILIMFAPEGAVSRLNFSHKPFNDLLYDQRPVQNMCLLVGKRENCPPTAVAGDKTLSSATLPASGSANRDTILADLKKQVNWLRGESRWIAIGSQSGRVVTIENASVDPLSVINDPKNSGDLPSSELLRNAQIQAAREFVREMKQLGGR